MDDPPDLGPSVFDGATVTSSPSAREPDALKGGDVYRWAREQTRLIREGRSHEIDWINVADEIEGVGISEFRSLASNLEVILSHILKWDHQAQRRSRSWAGSIAEHRHRVVEGLADSPSLKSSLPAAIDRGYRAARFVAARETRLDLDACPEACPYDWEAIMTRPFTLAESDTKD